VGVLRRSPAIVLRFGLQRLRPAGLFRRTTEYSLPLSPRNRSTLCAYRLSNLLGPREHQEPCFRPRICFRSVPTGAWAVGRAAVLLVAAVLFFSRLGDRGVRVRGTSLGGSGPGDALTATISTRPLTARVLRQAARSYWLIVAASHLTAGWTRRWPPTRRRRRVARRAIGTPPRRPPV